MSAFFNGSAACSPVANRAVQSNAVVLARREIFMTVSFYFKVLQKDFRRGFALEQHAGSRCDLA
jgi:hypothetical protein